MINLEINEEITTKVSLYHIEDEARWRGPLKRELELVCGVICHEFEIPENAGFDYVLAHIKEPAILLVDLRLFYPGSEFETVIELANHIDEIKHGGFELFILSGYLSQSSRDLLLKIGIPLRHIFIKGMDFTERKEEFLQEIIAAADRVSLGLPPAYDSVKFPASAGRITPFTNLQRHADLEKLRDGSIKPVLEIVLKLGGKELTSVPIRVNSKLQYGMDIIVKSLKAIDEFPDFIGKNLSLGICGLFLQLEESIFELRIPRSGEITTTSFPVVFARSTNDLDNRLFILVHLNNQLIAMKEALVEVV